jgi:ABC-type branched-subunit amino acid transport system substrate-binding protein
VTGGADGATSGTVTSGARSPSGGGGSVATPGGANNTTATTTRRGQVTTRGVTATTVQIGVGTSDVDTFAKTLGVSLSSGDTKAQLAALSKEIDKRGGILGRHVEFVEHKYNTAQTLNDPATANQAACATWTQDHHVFAVFSLTDPTLLECLKKSDTPLIDGGAGWGLDAMRIYRQVYDRYPNYFNIGAIVGDRFDEIAVQRLVARNYFQGWNTSTGAPDPSKPMKFGLIVADTQNGTYEQNSITKQLAKYNIKPTLVLRQPPGLSTSGANAQNAVLQMKAAGVTHIWGAGGVTHQAAEQQGYRPRYFLPIGTGVLQDFSPAKQLVGAMAMAAVPAMEMAGPPALNEDPSPATTECKSIMRGAGQTWDSASVLAAMEIMCDSFFFLQAAIQASGDLTTDGLRRGMESLGSRNSALTYQSVFGPGEHASARAMRDQEFNPSCGCFQFASKNLYVAGS